MRFRLALATLLLLTSCSKQTEVQDIATDEPTTETTTNESLTSFCTDTATPAPHLPAGDVLSLAKEEDAQQFAFADQKGAEIIPVDNNMSYAVWWQPEDFDVSTGTVVVSLHGHGDYAIQDFKVWHPELAQRNVAYLGLQWWFGRSLENEGYYEPDRIYSLIAEQLKAKNITAGNVIFEGFSMGGARSYGVALYDKACGNNYFGVNIANSGPWEDGYPLYTEILTKQYGETPYEGTHWILFCGDEDENEFATTKVTHVCDGMENTKQRLEDMGGTVDLFIQDPTGDHGSFMINKDNVDQAMDEAENLLKQE